jgi:Protein of unknown function (DUF1572)
MQELSGTIASSFTHYFEGFGRQVHALSERLSIEQFWKKPHPFGNSFGNLVLHLTGNLSYYIGTEIEGSGYVRDREAEFAEVVDGSKELALASLDAAVRMVIESLKNQSEVDWPKAYVAKGVDDVPDRFSMYLRCCVHFHHHIGQMIYIVKAWELSK